jgi:hypothetical protein
LLTSIYKTLPDDGISLKRPEYRRGFSVGGQINPSSGFINTGHLHAFLTHMKSDLLPAAQPLLFLSLVGLNFQPMSMLAKPLFTPLITRHHTFNLTPERRRLIIMNQVGQFVEHHTIYHPLECHKDLPVELQCPCCPSGI